MIRRLKIPAYPARGASRRRRLPRRLLRMPEATIELRLTDGDIARDPARAKRSCDAVVEEALRRRLSVTVFRENGTLDFVIQVSGEAAGRYLPRGYSATLRLP